MHKTLRKTRKVKGKGWMELKPGYHQKTVMLKKCGKKCFLGPHKSFPICQKNTCRINQKGVHAAYVRARQYRTISSKYRTISRKAKLLLQKK
jgi:hypothetical protein